jgi:hypothetical protein
MPSPDAIVRRYVAAARYRLDDSLAQIEHCLEQLSDDDLHWRPFEGHNSVSNIILHLCGNLRQWGIAGVTVGIDERDRPAEFTDRTRHARAELRDRLRATVAEAERIFEAIDPDAILAPRRIQGFEIDVLAAVFETVAHFAGHAQEITYIARTRLGEGYVFRWVPASLEEGAG